MSNTTHFASTALNGIIVLASTAVIAISSGAIAAEAHIDIIDDTVTGDAAITLNVGNIETPEGQLKVALYNSEEGYKGGQVVRAASADVSADTVSFSFEGLSDGEYLVAIYHDANSDNEMNANMFGIPTEQFGFSNDAMGRMGPPSWRAAKFTVDGTVIQDITLN